MKPARISYLRTFFYAAVIKQSSEQLCLPLLSVKYKNVVFPQNPTDGVFISSCVYLYCQ